MEHTPPPPGPGFPPPAPQFPPGSYPPVALLYHQPTAIPRPAGVTAIAIIGIVLASLWILTGLGGALSLAVMITFMTPGMMPPGFSGFRAVMLWNGISGLVSGLIAGWLLAVSIACLRMRPWGRSGIVRYAQVDLVWIVVKLAVALAWAIPAQQQWMNSVINTATPTTSPASTAPSPTTTGPASMSSPSGTSTMTTTVTTSGGTVSNARVVITPMGMPFDASILQSIMAAVTAIVSAIYPIVALIYMTRPRIKGAFTLIVPGTSGPADLQQS
jgi:hypothetical protein